MQNMNGFKLKTVVGVVLIFFSFSNYDICYYSKKKMEITTVIKDEKTINSFVLKNFDLVSSSYRNPIFPCKVNYKKKTSIATSFCNFPVVDCWVFKENGLYTLVLTNSKGKWSGQFFTLVYHLSELGDSIKSITQKAEFREPKSGWTELKQKLLQLKVLSLPDYHTIPEYDQVADGDAVIVEVSSKKVYRIYSYQEPRMFQNKFWQAANMERILELIEKEFGFKPLREL